MIEFVFYSIIIVYILNLVKEIINKKTYVRVTLKDMSCNGSYYVNLFDLKRGEILPNIIIKENSNIKSLKVNKKYITGIDYSEKIKSKTYF